jgi:hypothetical protein
MLCIVLECSIAESTEKSSYFFLCSWLSM